MNLDKKILDKIEQAHLTPKPKWMFWLQDFVLWFFGILFVVMGGFAIAVTIHIFGSSDWDVYEHFTDSFFSFILLSLPYIWIFCFLALILFVYMSVKYTKHGYRHAVFSMIAAVVVASVILGGLFYYIGFGETLHNTFSDRVPVYRTVVDKKLGRWGSPEKGFLGGKIIAVSSTNQFQIMGIKKKKWHISVEDDFKVPVDLISVGNKVRMMGRSEKIGEFRAEKVLPWEGRKPPKNLSERIHERKFRGMRINK